MRKLLTIIWAAFWISPVTGQATAPPSYSVFTIPAELTEKANAVVRTHETSYTVISAGQAVLKTHYVVTLLNEKAKSYASLHIGYDKLNQINYIKGTLYDALGNPVSKLKKSDIEDVSAISDFSLFEDNRAKVASFARTQYPYTVEFEYEINTRNLLFYPRWAPQTGQYVSVEEARFTVSMPRQLELRYKEINLQSSVTVSAAGENKLYNWNVAKLAAKERQPYGTYLSGIGPVVYTAPTDFEVEGYKGNMNTWESLGKWHYQLNSGRDKLPDELQKKLKQLVAGITDPAEKIRKLYEYLQANTRYVSIQLGIGGWQPFEARVVAEKGYGDCKALSNYMQSMLKAIGIESHYAAIRAGKHEPDILTDFPSSQFNHVVVCVPLVSDTLWLECTSQTNAFGYAGSFTGDRHALLITPQGGKLVKTPVYTASDNLQIRKATVRLDAQGDATAEVTTRYTGLQQESISGMMNNATTEQQKEWLYKHISIPSFELLQYSFAEQKQRIPAVTETLSLSVRKYGSKSGSRLFLPANVLTAWTSMPPAAGNQPADIELGISFSDVDTIAYHLPAGYQLEHLPEKTEFKCQFGFYSAAFEARGEVITYIRTMTVHKGIYPGAAYNEFAEFYRRIVKADKVQMVLVARQ